MCRDELAVEQEGREALHHEGHGGQQLAVEVFSQALLAGAHGALDAALQVDGFGARDHAVDPGAQVVEQLETGTAVEDFHLTPELANDTGDAERGALGLHHGDIRVRLIQCEQVGR